MKIIVPMAGRGSRLRPHTLTVPKPLIPIAGKPIVHRLVEDIASVINQDIEEIAFIIHKDFGTQVETDLISIDNRIVEGITKTVAYETNILGQEINEYYKGLVIIVYTDGSTMKVIR